MASPSAPPGPWFPYLRPQPGAKLRLFCLPSAGGAASMYRSWPAAFAPAVEVFPVQLPGRETRIREPAFTRFPELVATLAEALRPQLDRPWALFGHSLGARVGFELLRELRRTGLPLPSLFLVSGSPAPHLPPRTAPWSRFSDEALTEGLRELGGMPEELFQHPELLQMVLGVMRKDFELFDGYVWREEAPLDVPFAVFGGAADVAVKSEELGAWERHTRDFRGVRLFQGGHFYLESRRQELHDTLLTCLRPLLG